MTRCNCNNDITPKIVPFDLKRALAGDTFFRQYDGQKPTEWHYFDSSEANQKLCAVIGGEAEFYHDDGRFFNDKVSTSASDLVMYAKTKTLWIAISKKENNINVHTTSFAGSEKYIRDKFSNGSWDILSVEVNE